MEVIRIAGYTEDEKIILHEHLVPKQIEANGLKASEINITEAVLSGYYSLLYARSRCA